MDATLCGFFCVGNGEGHKVRRTELNTCVPMEQGGRGDRTKHFCPYVLVSLKRLEGEEGQKGTGDRTNCCVPFRLTALPDLFGHCIRQMSIFVVWSMYQTSPLIWFDISYGCHDNLIIQTNGEIQ